MSSARRICVVSGSRADYGLLQWVLQDIVAAPGLDLQLIVTGAHLEPRFGETVTEIVADGFPIAARVPLGLEDDSPAGTAAAMARGLSGVAEALSTLKPDLMLVLGDRYEILAAASAAMLHRLPVAHIAGGDITEGAFDDGIRHAVSKLAHVHFVTNDGSAARLRQMGEEPDRIHVVGSPGLDQLRRAPVMDRASLELALGAPLGTRNLLVTYHPVTLAPDAGLAGFLALLSALDGLPSDIVKWITRPNADPGHQAIEVALDAWAAGRTDVRLYASLGQARYLALMAQVNAVVGNSSSGLYEAPSLAVPTIDIGPRQAGRLAARSVLRCAADTRAIGAAIDQALMMDCTGVANPYGDGDSARRIVAVLESLPGRERLLAKTFCGMAA